MSSAVVPKRPRAINHFLFTPKNGILLFLMMYMQKVIETSERKRTNSCAGKPCVIRSLTKTFTIEKDTTEIRINPMALFTYLI